MINPESQKILQGCKVEASLKDAKPLSNFQFLKIGYFTVDEESTKDHLIFNRTVSLKALGQKTNKQINYAIPKGVSCFRRPL